MIKSGLIVIAGVLSLCISPTRIKGVDVTAVINVGRVLMESFSSTSVSTTDLTAAEELIRGLTFDKYEEKVNSKILTGIELTDFVTVIDRISTRHQIPEDIQESILDGQYADDNQEIIREFKFNIGQVGHVLYGRVATIKRDGGKIDIAYTFFQLLFKLSLKRIEEKHTKRFLGIVTRRKTVMRFEERNLGEKEMDHMFNFYRMKAIKGFKQEYPQLVAGSKDEL